MKRLDTWHRRFWRYVNKKSKNGCWIWIGTINRDGYGLFSRNGKQSSAHRISYEIANGKITDGKLICHHCDNRKCVNPNHLYAGTQADNIRDREKRGRGRRIMGEDHWKAKLTKAEVKEIRLRYSKGEPIELLAKEYDVHRKTIFDVVNRISWRIV